MASNSITDRPDRFNTSLVRLLCSPSIIFIEMHKQRGLISFVFDSFVRTLATYWIWDKKQTNMALSYFNKISRLVYNNFVMVK